MKNDANEKLQKLIESLVEQYINEVENDVIAQDPLVKIFIAPFTDVIKTAKGELERTTAITANTLGSLAKQAAVLAIPFFASSMINDIQKKSNEKLEERLNKIDERYAEVLKRTWDVLRKRDVWGVTFLLDPTFGIAEKFIAKTPYAALSLLQTLTGGHPKVAELTDQAKKFAYHVSPNYLGSFGGGSGGGYGGGYGGGFYGDFGDFGGDFGGGFGESVAQYSKYIIAEQPKAKTNNANPQQKQQIQNIKKRIAAAVAALKKDPSVQQAIQQSPIGKQMQVAAFEAIQDEIAPVMAATNYESLKKAIGPKFVEYEQKYMSEIPKEVKQDPKLLKQFQDEMVPQLKQAYKAVLLKQLQQLAKTHPNIAKPMGALIQKISKM